MQLITTVISNYRKLQLLVLFIFCVCKSGIIKQDPELPPDKLLNLPPPRPKNAIFEDEEKSKVRTCLLKDNSQLIEKILSNT